MCIVGSNSIRISSSLLNQGSVLVDSWPYLSCHVCELWFPRRLWLCSSSLWFLPHPPVLPLLLHDLHEESQGKEGRDQWQPLQWKDPQNGDWKWQHQAKEIKSKSWSSILSLENIFYKYFYSTYERKIFFNYLLVIKINVYTFENF